MATEALSNSKIKIYVLMVLIFLMYLASAEKYEPTWESIDSRPLPSWYDESKLGIFVHWGVFSVPSYGSEWFWHNWKISKVAGIELFMLDNYKPDFTYADFAKDYSAEFFSADEWARLFKSSGARYIVFVSKHHEGYSNYPSKYAFSWNSVDVGPQRDIVGELADAVRSGTDMHFGLYHSQYEWFNPLWLQDKADNFTTQDFVKFKTLPEWYEIVNKYKPDIVWSDGDWEATDEYWQAKKFIAWLYNDSPVKDKVVINDRWGYGIGCQHGGFYTCGDRYNPGHLVTHKWENAMTIDKYSWGYRRNARLSDYLSMDQLIETFVKTVSCGGNMLLNVGPRSDGIIDPLMQERLQQMGQWMNRNGEAIYGTRPWTYQNDTVNPNVWYTNKTTNGVTVVYAISLVWPSNGSLYLASPFPSVSTTVVSLLGYDGKLSWTPAKPKGLTITLPKLAPSEIPGQWAWVFKLEGLIKQKRKSPFQMPKFNVNKPAHPHYWPDVSYN
ncbi:alpha-L-fucosidase-like isoform X2 [Mercenaria mercenaria]|uniref:alpha-L-fucosidase-like isoform X2 n=1 Tax=Mercenaria mercenaria TaxID=6596 RepID=UPI00234E80BC|nr:alpha-L-fucosidase-like isoform X2 [Mercenaria mercenaria]